MPAKSVAQRKFMGMVRATQKGEMDNPSPELKRAANDMGAKAVNKFAKTKEKNLPQKIGDQKESYGVGGSLMFSGTPGGTSHSNTRVGNINKKDKKKKEVKEGYKGTADLSKADPAAKKKVEDRIAKHFGTKRVPGGKKGVKEEAAYTGPDKKDRAVIKKMDNKKFAAKLADYEKNMDPKKRQALKDKATKGMKFVHEDAPTMSTGSGADGAGFSQDADENGPTAGMDQPLGGTMKKMKGKGGLTKKKAKCKKSPDGINKVCESTEARYLSFLVQMEDVEFIFQGKSPADVKIRLRKIYRPEKLKGVKITRMLPAQVMHYYWEKRQASM